MTNRPAATVLVLLATFLAVAPVRHAQPAEPRIPIIHCTDLFHPHVDPDDHYDLACLFAVQKFDIRGIVLDGHGGRDRNQLQHCGRPAVEQMIRITGRKAPYAIGLQAKLKDRADKALDDRQEFQGGVRLILSALRHADQPVVINLTGSATDAAAAFNREPQLMRQKVRAVYIHAGNGPDGVQDEYNVQLDPLAYVRLLESGLPIYWCPCFGRQGYQTYYRVPNEALLIAACSPPVQNYFVYCLTRSQADPLEFLASGSHPLPTGVRNMWCTGPMLDAVGRKIYQRAADDFVALAPADAKKAGLAGKEVDVFRFVPVNLDTRALPVLKSQLHPAQSNIRIFQSADSRYEQILTSVLKNLLAGVR
jgi:hypothetical protein